MCYEKIFSFAIALALILSPMLCGYTSESVEVSASGREIIDGIVEQIMLLAEIPRESGNEKAVSDYLVAGPESIQGYSR